MKESFAILNFTITLSRKGGMIPLKYDHHFITAAILPSPTTNCNIRMKYEFVKMLPVSKKEQIKISVPPDQVI